MRDVFISYMLEALSVCCIVTNKYTLTSSGHVTLHIRYIFSS